MNTLFLQILVYILCFGGVWFGAGQVVTAVSRLARKWHLPAFTISFFLLGIITSLPEITIGSIAVLNKDPTIFAGNLLGGSIVMLMGIIPLLGIIGGGVKIPIHIDKKQLVFTLLVIVAPTFLAVDRHVSRSDAIFMIVLYAALFIFFSYQQSMREKLEKKVKTHKKLGVGLLLRALLGMGILMLASYQIVEYTIHFANILQISPFFVSLLVISLGTNIPEISIIFRAVLNRQKDIALADYLGSASANTLLFGIFTLATGSSIQLPNHSWQRLIFLSTGLILFYIFARSRKTLSVKESSLLFLLYILFVIAELTIFVIQ